MGAEKVVGKILSLDKAFSTLKDKDAKAQHKIVRKAERLYLKAAEAAGNGTLKKMILAQAPELEEEVKVQMAFAGTSAKTADRLRLETAKSMIQNGTDAETVRRETGWFKGYDGKWRFEIDDSEIEIAFNGKYSRDPEIQRYAELVDKVYFLDTATQEEQKELVSLDEKIGSKKITPASLGDLIDAPELFEAYPELQDIGIYFTDNTDGVSSYHPGLKEITLPKTLKREPTRAKKSLLHEIQHAIQDIEGFAEGGNLDSNRAAVEEVMDIMELTDAQKNVATLDMLEKYSDSVKRPIYDKLLNLSKRNGYESVKEYIKSLNRYSYYERIAGEVEARDVANRGEFDAEQRKNTRPDIDREDVVFADNSTASYEIKRDKNGNEYWQIDSGKDIFKGLSNPEEYRDAAFEYLIANRDNKVVVKDDVGRDIIFIRLSAEEFTRSEQSQDLFDNDPEMFKQKMRLIPSLEDILLHTKVSWPSPDHKNHNMFKERGFENYRGRVRIDNVIFTSIVRVGKAKFGDVFYDINLEVDSYLPHTNSGASDIKESTSNHSIAQNSEKSTETEKKVSVDGKVVQMSLAEGANQQTSDDIDALIKSAGIEGDAAEIREDLAELYRMASDADMDTKKGHDVIARISKRIATEMVRKGKLADGEASEDAVARLQKEILARMDKVSFYMQTKKDSVESFFYLFAFTLIRLAGYIPPKDLGRNNPNQIPPPRSDGWGHKKRYNYRQ